jgi:hypothetical protein
VAVKHLQITGSAVIFLLWQELTVQEIFQVLRCWSMPKHLALVLKWMSWFSNNEKPQQSVIGKNPETHQFKVKKDGGDFDAITASTITSRAFLEALVQKLLMHMKNVIMPAMPETNKNYYGLSGSILQKDLSGKTLFLFFYWECALHLELHPQQ